jgi:hypothetical protein
MYAASQPVLVALWATEVQSVGSPLLRCEIIKCKPTRKKIPMAVMYCRIFK